MAGLNNIRIGVSPLTNEIYLYRHGKDIGLALDKRPCEKDVFLALVRYMMADAPKGASKKVRSGDQWYEIKVVPCDAPNKKEAPNA